MSFFHSFLFLFLGSFLAFGQTIKVQPYLQDATDSSIYISWETDLMDESIVDWGLTSALGNSTIGNALVSSGTSRIHEVKLSGLLPYTKYFYRVRTGSATSSIFTFKTPPLPDAGIPFRIVAMSDMQQDNAFPNKFADVIQDGVIDYLSSEFGGEIIDNLALVMIPGDLVDNGLNYGSWEETFFTPAQNLFKHVPVYPVLGNHENNATYYFKYFRLPENGTVGFEEHWWHKDYGNVRIIGLNSNSPFNTQIQLDWLEELLDSTALNPNIDFVFAQLHHPHKSELWTPGESPYTGEVITLLEQFTTSSGKPSIHFFGHTHAYSRGDSRDHKHVWLNAATAGGAIDNWGEFPNADYDEFSVSQDDYGFVSVEVTGDNNPSVVIRRYSLGDQNVVLDNVLSDSLTIRLNPSVVNTPAPIDPINIELAPECVVLHANAFSSPTLGMLHGQSHWQVSTDSLNFSAPVAESWKKFENWYYEINTQAADDLSDEKINGLLPNSSYWWRVRYRDRELNWSNWTTSTPFTTGNSVALPNLLLNPGSEDSLANWIVIEGVVESLLDGECSGTTQHGGNRYFAVGGLCDHSPVGRCIQEVDVTSYATEIDAGNLPVNFGGYLSDYSGDDLPEMRLIFYGSTGNQLGTSDTLWTLNNTWTYVNQSLPIPALTRTIRMELKGTRNVGTDNDSYFDDLFLSVGVDSINCFSDLSVVNIPAPSVQLKVVPNPVTSTSKIELPEGNYSNLKLFVIDATGQKVSVSATVEKNSITLSKANLAQGLYYFWVKDENYLIGKGKIQIQ